MRSSRALAPVLVAVTALGLTLPLAATATAAKPRTLALPSGLQPEGITSHGNRYWVGGMNDGRIVTGSFDGGATTVLLGGETGRKLRGMQFDTRTGLLWVVGNVDTVSHVWAVDTRTGAIASNTVIPGGMFLNDLIITGTAVWVTDSKVERLTRIALTSAGAPTDDAPTFLALGGAWPGAQGGNSANGIRRLDATHVVLDHSTAGGLWSVDLATGAATEIRVTGGPAITGGDGLERRDSILWVVRGIDDETVSRLKLTRDGSGWRASYARSLTDPTLDVPSTATYSVGALWAVNARFGNPSPTTAAYYVTRLN